MSSRPALTPARCCAVLFSVVLSSACATTRAAGDAAPTGASPGGAPTARPASTAKPAPPSKVPMATAPDGTKIAYEVNGTGPAILLLPGGGQTRGSWKDRGYVDRLAKSFTVIAFDLRGTGDSGKPAAPAAYALDRMLEDALAVADAAGAKRFHVWGFGHGGAIGRYLAARSDRVISAVLMGSTMGPALDGVVRNAVTGMRARWLPILEAQAAGTLDKSTMAPGDVLALEGGVGTSALLLGAMLDYPVLEPSEIKAPTLWLVGAADASAMENVKAYEPKLKGTAVTLKLLDGLSYSDSFARIDPALAAVEPFLKAAPATN